MKPFKIAVTGVGGGVGQSIIKSLQDTDYKLVGLDGEIHAAGLYAVPSAFIIPYAINDDYIPQLLSICEREEIDLLFPGLDAELEILSNNRERFQEIDTSVVVSRPEVISIADDKMLTSNWLKEHGFLAPATLQIELVDWHKISYPVIIKPQLGGARSKSVYVVRSMEDALRWTASIGIQSNNFVVQEYIDGQEYTCGTVNLDGSCKGVIVMKRILRDGDTYKCFTEISTGLEGMLEKLMNELQPMGACNVQLRISEGRPYIFEINARCSGTTAARSLCGFNEPKMIADYLLKGLQPQFNIESKTILRYWNELVADREAIKDITSSGHHQGISHSL